MAICCAEISSYKQDSLWSWFICFCTLICWMLTIGFTNAFGVAFPVLMDSFKTTRENTAWVTSIVNGVGMLLGPVMAGLLNRFGFRITTILGCLSCSAGLAMGSFVPNIITLYFAYSLPFAVGISLIFVSGTIIVNHYFTERRSVALGLVTAGSGLGTMILGPTLQALLDVLHWRNTFRLFAGLLAIASLFMCFLHQETSSTDEHKKAPSKKFRLNFSLLKSPDVLLILITSGIFNFSRFVPLVHLIKYCDDLGIPPDKSSTVYLFIGIFISLGRFGGGFLCDIESVNTRLLFQAATFIMGASTMLLTLAKTYGALVAYAIVFSAADGLMVTTFIIECLKSVEEWEKASVFGLQMMLSCVFALSSPPLSGLMADTFGNYIAAFLMAGGVGIAASLIPFMLLCVKRESQEISDRVIIEEAVNQEQWKDTQGDDLSLQQLDNNELRPTSDSVENVSLRARQSSFLSYRRRQSSFTVRRPRQSSFLMAMESPFDYHLDPSS